MTNETDSSRGREVKLTGYTSTQLLHHAVLSYAKVWVLLDSRYKAEAAKSKQALAPILISISNDYRVTRTFGKSTDSVLWEGIAQYILTVQPPAVHNYVQVVDAMAGAFPLTDSRGRVRYPLSGASKLLWFKFGVPIKIYDVRAVVALRRLKKLKRIHSYAEFCDAWDSAYSIYKKELEKALVFIAGKPELTLIPYVELQSKNIFHEAWFIERSFDQFLWLIGDSSIKFEFSHGDGRA